MISTQPSLLQPKAINDAFASDFIYWTKPFPQDKLQDMLDRSLCLGLYDTKGSSNVSKWQQIGLFRSITDAATFIYSTDFYVLPQYRNMHLGEWLIDCHNEVVERIARSMDRSVRGLRWVTGAVEGQLGWYEQKMGLKRIEQGRDGFVYIHRLLPEKARL